MCTSSACQFFWTPLNKVSSDLFIFKMQKPRHREKLTTQKSWFKTQLPSLRNPFLNTYDDVFLEELLRKYVEIWLAHIFWRFGLEISVWKKCRQQNWKWTPSLIYVVKCVKKRGWKFLFRKSGNLASGVRYQEWH